MQVPERLALIGGSILLASTLVFTLKSQASQILPKISSPISSIYDHAGDAQNGSSFPSDFKDAQRHGEKTGTWGTSKYYIDDQGNLHIGRGELDRPIYDVFGADVNNIKTINLDENVRAPQNSDSLFSGNNYHNGPDNNSNTSITQINGLDKLDVSQTTVASDMFYRDLSLSTPMNLDHWDTSHITDMRGMFGNTNIPSFDIKDWDVRQNTGTGWMFYNDYNLNHLDLSNWHLDNIQYTNDTFAGDMNLYDLNIANFKPGSTDSHGFFGGNSGSYGGPVHNLNQLALGNDARFDHLEYFPQGTWKSGNQTLSDTQLNDGNAHPGTWIKQ